MCTGLLVPYERRVDAGLVNCIDVDADDAVDIYVVTQDHELLDELDEE